VPLPVDEDGKAISFPKEHEFEEEFSIDYPSYVNREYVWDPDQTDRILAQVDGAHFYSFIPTDESWTPVGVVEGGAAVAPSTAGRRVALAKSSFPSATGKVLPLPVSWGRLHWQGGLCQCHPSPQQTRPAFGPCTSLSGPCGAIPEPCGIAPEPCEVISEPCEIVPVPCETNSEPCETMSVACEALPEPCETTSEPCEIISVACEIVSHGS